MECAVIKYELTYEIQVDVDQGWLKEITFFFAPNDEAADRVAKGCMAKRIKEIKYRGHLARTGRYWLSQATIKKSS